MPDLGFVIGSLLTSLAQARRMADEETTAIAEYYRSNPLLEGMSLPRVRVPELILELPMIIEAQEEGEPNVPNDPDVIQKAINDELIAAAKREGFELSDAFKKRFDREMQVEIEKLTTLHPVERGAPREVVVRAVDNAFARTISQERLKRPTPDQQRIIASELRKIAANVALKQVGRPPTIDATIVTAEVKEKAGSGNVIRLQLRLREEGLEWSAFENPDGTLTSRLIPE